MNPLSEPTAQPPVAHSSQSQFRPAQFRYGRPQTAPSGWKNSRALAAGLKITLLLVITGLIAGCSCEDPKVKFDRLMSEADASLEADDYNAARINLLAAIDLQPKNAKAYFKLAEAQVHLQAIGQAVENYRTAINYDPDHREARLHLASILLAARQFEQAEGHVVNLLEKKENDLEAMILKANIESVGPRQNTEGAKKILNKVLEREPKNVSALASFAHAELKEGDAKTAEEYFSKALAADPDNGSLQMALADLYARQGRLDEAQERLKTLISQNPEESGLRYIFGEFLLRRGQSKDALEQYQKTIVSEPKNHKARDRLYDMYLARQRIEDAKKLSTDLKALDESDPGVAYFEGRNLELEGKPAQALEKFQESLKLLNNFAPAFRRAGLRELASGEQREGIEHLNQAVAIDGSDVGARLALARHFYLQRELDQASEHIDQVLRRYPRQLGANLLKADIALLEGNLDRARKVYEFFVQAFPKNPSAAFKMGLLEERANNYDKAINWYKKTLEYDEDVLPAARRYVYLLSRDKSIDAILEELQDFRDGSRDSKGQYSLLMGSLHLANSEDEKRFEKARALYKQAIAEDENLIGAYYALGAIDSKDGNLEDAIANYDKLLKKNEEHIPTLMLRAMAYERLGNTAESMQGYNKILDASPGFGAAANNLAFLLVEKDDASQEDLDRALKLARTAKEQMPRDSSVTDTLGWVHFKRGSSRVALPLFEEAVELEEEKLGPDKVNPEILYHLAAVLTDMGDDSGAKKFVNRALKSVGDTDHPKKDAMKELQAKL